MNHRRWIYLSFAIVAVAVVFQILPWWLGEQDLAALQRNAEPKFTRPAAPTPDGGSVRYQGFGYTLWNLHRLTNFGAGRHGLIVGVRIEYWLPLGLTRNRYQTEVLNKTEEWGWRAGGATNASQPIREETDSTSGAVDPRR